MRNFTSIDEKWLDETIERTLQEDIQKGDVTTVSIIDSDKRARAVWLAKQDGVIAGLDVAKRVFQKLDPNIIWKPAVSDGDTVKRRNTFTEFEGNCRALLTAERVALNFAQRMSGIATKTAKMVRELEGRSTKILDTRKTVPGLRILDKYAVKTGGGTNHRMGLFDMAMIKDNHISAAGNITLAVKRVRTFNPDVKIEVETTSLEQVSEALEAGADIIMLDNMDTVTMQQAVRLVGNQAITEASGNMSLERLKETAETGVDFISVGALTHSVEAFDISQQIIEIF
jgi:nicotinate-nucleotide pyrophosphorylase (carboxylating)